MTLYELIKCVSDIITPETNDFYQYVLYTSDDDGGFLRTRYCWWEKPVSDRKLSRQYTRVLVACAREINEKDLVDREGTKLKLQFHYDYANADFDDADWDLLMGYGYLYLFDLTKNEYIMERRECIY